MSSSVFALESSLVSVVMLGHIRYLTANLHAGCFIIDSYDMYVCILYESNVDFEDFKNFSSSKY